MIDLSASGVQSLQGASIDNFSNIAENDIERFDYFIESGLENPSIEMQGQAKSNNESITQAAADYMIGTKNSLIDKSQKIHDSYLGDENFSFTDKIQLLEKTYNYQLEMTFYNTFMSQTLQKVDALIQLK